MSDFDFISGKLEGGAIFRLNYAEFLSLNGLFYEIEIDQAIAAGQSIWFRFFTPPDRHVQIITRFMTPQQAGMRYRVYRTASNPSLGDPIIPYKTNAFRGVAPTSVANLLTAAPSNPTNGRTRIYSGQGGGAATPQRGAGTQSSFNGIDSYGPNTEVFGQIEELSGANNYVNLVIGFTEIPV